jgi:hypothetical protein
METTMNADELRALAERVQGLDGPSYVIDCEVWDVVYPGERASRIAKALGNKAPLPSHEAEFIKAPPLRSFTASLDAAMTLCPDDHGEGPWLPCIESDSSWNGVRWRAQLGHYCYDATESCYAATPALALTAAALLARAEQESQQ